MGFLTDGNTLPWEQVSKIVDYIRQHGILQFLEIYKRAKDRCNDSLKWGDEIEYILVHFDPVKCTARLSLRGPEILDEFLHEEQEKNKAKYAGLAIFAKSSSEPLSALWRPEYGRHMVEGTPGAPYGSKFGDLLQVEANMASRRALVAAKLKSYEAALTIAVFPLMGVGEFTEPAYPPGGPVTESLFIPDQIIHVHPRFPTLTANIRKRRGAKVAINVPVFKDTKTQPILPVEKAALKDCIYMDAMAFGMGNCCLQCTLQCCNINEARHFYDQFAVLAPIMLALTAASPAFRGLLADQDVRWRVIAASVDDRTPEELGHEPLKTARHVINKSRYDSIDCFLSTDKSLKPEYNDLNLVYDKAIAEQLQKAGIDTLLSRHLAHLFIRDPLVIYDNRIEIDDATHADHFENIQSTNWQTVRFKPPPPQSSIGWRVEFRPMEVQITDFENAAFSVFIILLSRVISALDLNFYMPISKVDQNMEIAHRRNAVLAEKFLWRKNVTKDTAHLPDEYEPMTINEIMNGKNGGFAGLIPLLHMWLDSTNIQPAERTQLNRYLRLVSKRASGELCTAATYIRNFVRSHPAYQHDSVISPRINYDLLVHLHRVMRGELHPPALLGDLA